MSHAQQSATRNVAYRGVQPLFGRRRRTSLPPLHERAPLYGHCASRAHARREPVGLLANYVRLARRHLDLAYTTVPFGRAAAHADHCLLGCHRREGSLARPIVGCGASTVYAHRDQIEPLPCQPATPQRGSSPRCNGFTVAMGNRPQPVQFVRASLVVMLWVWGTYPSARG